MKRPFLITIFSFLSVFSVIGMGSTTFAFQTEGTVNDMAEISLHGLIPETDANSTKIKLEDGMTQPIYSLENAVLEQLFVETTVDSDSDGKHDRVSIEVIRPETDPGVKVPAIYEMSPYRAGLLWDTEWHNVDHELHPVVHPGKRSGAVPSSVGDSRASNFGSLESYYVPRGYAVILGESIGTGKSDGCPTVGDEREILATNAVIDWLNGRAKAYNVDGQEVAADWSTGNVGMTGVSYNGTLPNAAATTGIEGLKTIVPISAISSWYDYYRANGAVVAPGGYQGEDADIMGKVVLTRDNPEICEGVMENLIEGQDRLTGDYNDFWDNRNYVKDAKDVQASVFVVHGLNDWNVKTKQFAQWWKALEKYNVPRKMWLHQGSHGGTSANSYKETENRWFDYWLYGIENGIMDEPMVEIEREDRTWHQEENWPNPEAEPTSFHFKTGNDGGEGTLRIQGDLNLSGGTEDLIDAPMKTANLLVADPESYSPNRLAYLTPNLAEQVRMSGTPEIKIQASIDRPVANLTALLVDYGGTKPEIVTRGWMDPQNRNADDVSTSIVPNQGYTFKWDMQPDDYVFQPGHRIGIVLIASDYDYTIRPTAGTKITVMPTSSEIKLPIVGGEQALKIISAVYIKTIIDGLEEQGEFANDDAVHSLKLHLTAVERFEKQEAGEKVVKHVEGFKGLLDYQKDNELISEKAYNALKDYADYLIMKWQ